MKIVGQEFQIRPSTGSENRNDPPGKPGAFVKSQYGTLKAGRQKGFQAAVEVVIATVLLGIWLARE